MPTYPVKNNKTGEEKELSMSMKAYDTWRKENPDWDKDWSKGCASAGEVGDWRNKTDGGWNEVLHKVSKAPGANVKPYKYY
tara:strand:+ start:55 stop:297 length:243 start_codon:yes stop_codon:yes gene_type:complete